MAESLQKLPLAAKELPAMDKRPALADPQPDRPAELQREQIMSISQPVERSGISAQLDRYDIAVVLNAVYEWGGYRYTNATDAIAAASRAEGPRGTQ
jgi:hypothetical protein